jgi:hypothetical protein
MVRNFRSELRDSWPVQGATSTRDGLSLGARLTISRFPTLEVRSWRLAGKLIKQISEFRTGTKPTTPPPLPD